MRIAKSHEKYVCSRIFVLQVKDQIRDILVLSLAPNVHPFQTRNISWRGVVNIFIIIPSLVGLIGLVICMNLHHFASASKSKTISFVSSVPFRDPTAHTWEQNKVVTGNYLNFGERAEDNWENYLTSLVGEERILQTTPPEPPDSRATKSRMKSPAHKFVKEPI